MDKIQVSVLNPFAIYDSEKMAVMAARLTQRGHVIKSIDDINELYNLNSSPRLLGELCALPHPTLQKLAVVNVAIVGASRRFLSQITRHQNEVKFISASMQYSDYTGNADFVVPQGLINNKRTYIEACRHSLEEYEAMIRDGVSHDDAAYMLPQSLRNVLIISATPYQFKHMISQRICRRNTIETRYVMLKVWDELYKLSQILFSPETTGAACMKSRNCPENKMSCGEKMENTIPQDILKKDFAKCLETIS